MKNFQKKRSSKTYIKENHNKDYFKLSFNETLQSLNSSFDNATKYFIDIQICLNSQNYTEKNIEQPYNNFLEEIDRIKRIMEKILLKETNNSSSHLPKDNNIEKKVCQKISPNIKLYKNQQEQLYEKDGINIDTIESKSSKIREEIQKYSLYFEDQEKNIQTRNKFLETVANIAVLADEFSYKLIKILLKNFNEERKFGTIIYERAKTKFSAWVNKRLEIESSQTTKFFEDECTKEFKSCSLNIIEKGKAFFQYYNKLFVDLCELFTISLLYSEKNIELKYIKRGEKYQQDEMKDITELNKIRYVNFTILPGLSVNKKCFKFAKALVFCEPEPKFKIIYNINEPKQNTVDLNGTIKTEEVNDKLEIKINCQRQGDSYIFKIDTQPDIPIDDNPLFLMRYYIRSSSSWNYFQQGIGQGIFILDRKQIPKNSAFSFDVQINGVRKINQSYIETNKILNS